MTYSESGLGQGAGSRAIDATDTGHVSTHTSIISQMISARSDYRQLNAGATDPALDNFSNTLSPASLQLQGGLPLTGIGYIDPYPFYLQLLTNQHQGSTNETIYAAYTGMQAASPSTAGTVHNSLLFPNIRFFNNTFRGGDSSIYSTLLNVAGTPYANGILTALDVDYVRMCNVAIPLYLPGKPTADFVMDQATYNGFLNYDHGFGFGFQRRIYGYEHGTAGGNDIVKGKAYELQPVDSQNVSDPELQSQVVCDYQMEEIFDFWESGKFIAAPYRIVYFYTNSYAQKRDEGELYAGERPLMEVPANSGMGIAKIDNLPFWAQEESNLGINDLSPIAPDDTPAVTVHSKHRPYSILDNSDSTSLNSGLGVTGAPFRNQIITSYDTVTGNGIMINLKNRFKTRGGEMHRSSEWLTARVNQLQTAYVDSLIDIPKEYRVKRQPANSFSFANMSAIGRDETASSTNTPMSTGASMPMGTSGGSSGYGGGGY